jgi:hypothetical protein
MVDAELPHQPTIEANKMKAIKIAIVVLLTLLALTVWLLPIGPVSGFFIGGTSTTVPDNWSDTSAIHEIKLKVSDGGLPRVVTIWVIQVNNELHVVGAKDSGWVETLGQGGAVLMRLENKTYALQASLVTNWQPIVEAYMDKYRPDYPDIVNGFPDSEEAADSMRVFRLTRG